MRKSVYLMVSLALFLSGCKGSKKSTEAEFKVAINRYLEDHNQACIWLGQPFPIDISRSHEKYVEGIPHHLAILEEAGLVHSAETVTTPQGILGGTTQQNIRRYEPTDAGKPYLHQVQAVLRQSAGFCYGTKTVDSIINSTKSANSGPALLTEVTYTYKITDLAPWARRPDIPKEFGDVRTTIDGVSKQTETIGLQLTDQGWVVPGR
jgi:hypothetical protein